jgi:hypothetical protein
VKYLDKSFTEAVGSEEFREGHARIFGDKPRETGRRRYVYTQNGNPLPAPVEVSQDWQNSSGVTAPVTDLYMDGVRATDGTDIGSRAKRREYMKRENLADASDYTQTWAKAKQEREAFFSGKQSSPERREAIARALTQRKK